MQKALQEMIRNKLTTLQRLEVSHERIINNEDVLSMVMHADAENIRMTLEGVNKESFDQVVRAILSARKVYIVGIRSASAIAEFLGPAHRSDQRIDQRKRRHERIYKRNHITLSLQCMIRQLSQGGSCILQARADAM